MKILLINGSPHEDGVCNRAFEEMIKVFDSAKIETEKLFLGAEPLYGCISCGSCFRTKRCFRDDIVSKIGARINEFDGIVVASPVHYASASGVITTFLDRLFYAYGRNMHHKLFAAIATARRGGTTATLDQLYKYSYIAGMIAIGGQYWNMLHGNTKEEAEADLEGLQNLRTLANNMVWLLKSIEAGKEKGLEYPTREKGTWTNFIR